MGGFSLRRLELGLWVLGLDFVEGAEFMFRSFKGCARCQTSVIIHDIFEPDKMCLLFWFVGAVQKHSDCSMFERDEVQLNYSLTYVANVSSTDVSCVLLL